MRKKFGRMLGNTRRSRRLRSRRRSQTAPHPHRYERQGSRSWRRRGGQRGSRFGKVEEDEMGIGQGPSLSVSVWEARVCTASCMMSCW